MKNKNIRKRLWCLLASFVSFVPSSKAMKTEASVDPSGYEASDEASDSDYNDFMSKLNESKKNKPKKKKVIQVGNQEEQKKPSLKVDSLDLSVSGIAFLWWLTGGRPVTTSWNKIMHNVDFFDSKYRKVMFRDAKGLNTPSRGHSISVGDTYVETFGPAPISQEEKDSWISKIKSGVKSGVESVKVGLKKTKNFITRKTKEELQKEEEANKKIEKELTEDSKKGTFVIYCNKDKQEVNFSDFKDLKNKEENKGFNKVIVQAQCNDVFLADIPDNINYLCIVGANNVSISSDLTKLKYFEVHCRNLYLAPPYKFEKNNKKGVLEENKLKGNAELVEAVLDVRALFSLNSDEFNNLWNAQKTKKEPNLNYGFKKLLTINKNGESNLPGFGKLENFKVTGSLGEGNWLKFEKKNKEEAK